MLYRLAARTGSDQYLNTRGGIFILLADQVRPEELTLLETSSRLILDGEKGSLDAQVPSYSVQVFHLPQLTTTRPPLGVGDPPPLASKPAGLFPNGFGCFSADGREYIIDLPAREAYSRALVEYHRISWFWLPGDRVWLQLYLG